ncbi:MAG: phosphoribosyltransferase [Deltaproteobacteria bacterium]|nr:phosphoribosyltransferase [Deltaproteobacteria bacterium]
MSMNIYELKKFRDKHYIFADRWDAGLTLASMIRSIYGQIKDGIVLAIPSGGVPVGMKVSETLGLSFDLAIVRKLQIPGNPEAGFGAITLDGSVFINEPLLAELNLSQAQIEKEKKRVQDELTVRNSLFREGRPFPSLKGKSVIIVDDGIASGYTMLASVYMAKEQTALKTIVAVPTAPMRSIEKIGSKVDAVFCPNIRTAPYFAVAEAYQHWYDLSQEEVLELL